MKKALRPMVPNFNFFTYCRAASMSFDDLSLQISLPEPLNSEVLLIYNSFPRNILYVAYCLQYQKLNDARLENFLNDPKTNGTIVIAFGTILIYAPRKYVAIIVETLNQLTNYPCPDRSPMKLGKHISMWPLGYHKPICCIIKI
uniref:Glucuronosyltransferase n=1 Tax=Elaeophora elaphi TaxID=1147741 RepID=A0A0R3RJD4_9BILA